MTKRKLGPITHPPPTLSIKQTTTRGHGRKLENWLESEVTELFGKFWGFSTPSAKCWVAPEHHT